MATLRSSPPPAGHLVGATRPSEPPAELEQPDQRLGVARLVDERVELGQRARLDVDALVLVRLGLRVREVRGEVDVALLIREPRRGVEGGEVLPLRRGLADLLRELALGGVERRLALDVELARRQLEQVGGADGLARLAHEVDALAVVGDDGDRALVPHDLARDLLAVLVAERLRADRDELALVPGLPAGGLEARAHAAAASSSKAKATSSMPSSAATETRSVGSWLRSVPLARLTHGSPAASSALASEPPPVRVRRGSRRPPPPPPARGRPTRRRSGSGVARSRTPAAPPRRPVRRGCPAWCGNRRTGAPSSGRRRTRPARRRRGSHRRAGRRPPPPAPRRASASPRAGGSAPARCSWNPRRRGSSPRWRWSARRGGRAAWRRSRRPRRRSPTGPPRGGCRRGRRARGSRRRCGSRSARRSRPRRSASRGRTRSRTRRRAGSRRTAWRPPARPPRTP